MDWLRGQVTTVLRNISPRTRVALSLTGLAAGALLAYALYFDYRRRTEGDYKEKLRASESNSIQ
jgi:MAS20 protein import receptor